MEREKEPEESEKDAAAALEAFFAQFGEIDAHAAIVLEEFFKELMDGE